MSLEMYQYHVLDEQRLADVQYLFREVFRKQVSLDYLRAKYDTSWCGVPPVCFLAYQEGQVVAFYGALPQEFSYRGNRFLAAHTCDSITLPAHQRKGLHKALAERTYARMRAHGIRFVYAFHSENTYHSCKKLHWKEGVTMRGFWVKSGGLPWGKVARKLPLLRQWYQRRTARILAQADRADLRQNWHRTPNDGPLEVHYNAKFFAYKSFTPNAALETHGVRFWVQVGAILSVGDAQFDETGQLAQGIEGLKALARRLGLARILFQTAPGFPLNQWMEQHHAGFDTWLVGYLDFESGLPLDHWRMRFGDLDTF